MNFDREIDHFNELLGDTEIIIIVDFSFIFVEIMIQFSDELSFIARVNKIKDFTDHYE